jgi:hypothetical protein
MATESVIDLGLDRSPPEDQGPRWDPRRWWAWWRRALLSGLCLTAVATTTASAPPPSPGLTLLAELGENIVHYQISGDYLILAAEDAASSVYRLPAGDHLWTQRDLRLRQSEWPDVFYSYNCVEAGTSGCRESETIAWDAATGARLWSTPGEPVSGTDGRLHLVAGHNYVTATDGETWFRLPDRLEVRDETGVRWSTDSPAGLNYFVYNGADAPVVVVFDRFSVAAFDAATGAVLGRYRVPGPNEQVSWVLVTYDLLLVSSFRRGGDSAHTLVRAFDPETLTPRWQRRWRGEGWVTDCGELLCADWPGVDGQRMGAVLDPDTGADLWVTAGEVWAVGDRFVVWSADESPYRRPADTPRVVAPHTGETLVDLTAWTVVGLSEAEGTLVLTAPTSAGTAVALLDPGALAPRYLGSVATEFERCSPFAEGLVCAGDTGLTLWAVDPAGLG